MHPGSIEYTQRVSARSILLDEKDRRLAEIFYERDLGHSARSLRRLRKASNSL
jgi:hypothetical protein